MNQATICTTGDRSGRHEYLLNLIYQNRTNTSSLQLGELFFTSQTGLNFHSINFCTTNHLFIFNPFYSGFLKFKKKIIMENKAAAEKLNKLGDSFKQKGDYKNAIRAYEQSRDLHTNMTVT
jgi:hypothetical protein